MISRQTHGSHITIHKCVFFQKKIFKKVHLSIHKNFDIAYPNINNLQIKGGWSHGAQNQEITYHKHPHPYLHQ